jgi:hypothetical protein
VQKQVAIGIGIAIVIAAGVVGYSLLGQDEIGSDSLKENYVEINEEPKGVHHSIELTESIGMTSQP